jgi:sugar phosphate isomerase/epimerase
VSAPGPARPRVGCQTYTWQALLEHGGERWPFEAIVEAIAAAGFEGLETTPTMLGDLFDQPERCRALLEANGLQLAALALSSPSGWTNPAREAEDLAVAERAIRFLEPFGLGARLALGGGRSTTSADPEAQFEQMLRRYHQVAEQAVARGVVVNVHPTSAPGSILRTRADYDRLAAALDPRLLSLGPDTGHIVRGDEAPLAFIQRLVERITHVHLKDAYAGGDYAFMGSGDADLPAVLAYLRQCGYTGWLIAEEESEASRADPAGSVRACREYLRALGC